MKQKLSYRSWTQTQQEKKSPKSLHKCSQSSTSHKNTKLKLKAIVYMHRIWYRPMQVQYLLHQCLWAPRCLFSWFRGPCYFDVLRNLFLLSFLFLYCRIPSAPRGDIWLRSPICILSPYNGCRSLHLFPFTNGGSLSSDDWIRHWCMNIEG